jgi:hypothetical protein
MSIQCLMTNTYRNFEIIKCKLQDVTSDGLLISLCSLVGDQTHVHCAGNVTCYRHRIQTCSSNWQETYSVHLVFTYCLMICRYVAVT